MTFDGPDRHAEAFGDLLVGQAGGQCVEVGQGNGVLVRDIKTNGTGPLLRLAAADWTSFLRKLKA